MIRNLQWPVLAADVMLHKLLKTRKTAMSFIQVLPWTKEERTALLIFFPSQILAEVLTRGLYPEDNVIVVIVMTVMIQVTLDSDIMLPLY